MEFTIIEDCSPCYIRFTHKGIEDIIKYCDDCAPNASIFQNGTLIEGFKHYCMPQDQITHILNTTPVSNYVPLQYNRASLFISQPGMYYRAHKDGMNHRVSINYTVRILDDKCVTSWYSDEDLQDYPIDNLPGNMSRECLGFKKENHTPIKSMTAVQGECILFNTDLFHDWDNRNSTNERIVLTLRISGDRVGSTYFDDVKRMLFNL